MSTQKTILIGCGIVFAVFMVLVIAGVIWIATGPQGGVRLSNEMEEYALEYLETHQLLDSSEVLVAYYDATLRLDGSEAAILTDKRIIYHKGNRTESINLPEIEEIKHRKEILAGDILEIFSTSGQSMKITIVTQGETFLNALTRTRRKAKKTESPPIGE